MKRLWLLLILVFCLFWQGRLQAEKLAYALSGGGARGFAHIGVLKVLEEEGIRPDYLTGTSIGAIIGGLYSMGYSAAEIEDICLSIDWLKITQDAHQRGDLYIGQKRWMPYGNVVFELNDKWKPLLPSGVIVGNKINMELFRITAPASQVTDFSRLPIPFACVATNLETGQPEVFHGGSLMQALRASMSIPSLVKPFEINSNIYIDGGVSQNLPVEQLHQLGADKVIGIKVNSTLRDKDKLNNLVEILDQTINIGITRNLNENLDDCDLLIEPDLSGYSGSDFSRLEEIIALGEQYARAHIDEIRDFRDRLGLTPQQPKIGFDKELGIFHIGEIRTQGNRFISAAKVEEYLNLKLNRTYTTEHICAAFDKAWNSQVFSTIYPELTPRPDGAYILTVHLKEKDRKALALNLSYTSDDNLNAGLVLSLNNYLLKNSKLLSEVKLGGRNEFNLDYVKNFGEEWGAYYRIFSYLNEKTIYNYENHYRVSSSRSLEGGATTGVGLFAKDLLIGELYLYTSQTKLYADISPVSGIPRNSIVSGVGIKTYHESVDDYFFPTSGLRIYNKFNFARSPKVSDFVYSSYQGKGEIYLPLAKKLSGELGINYGSYFNGNSDDKLDPYYIGGTEGFLGYSRYELSAPHFEIVTAGLSASPFKAGWLTLGGQALRYADTDVWGIQKDWEYCVFAGVGFKSNLLPARLIVALNEAGRVNTLLNIGYDLDIFRFSRK